MSDERPGIFSGSVIPDNDLPELNDSDIQRYSRHLILPQVGVEGQVEGVILTERHGTGGFGYDSIFQPIEGDGSTFAQMSPQDKNRISHRGRAVARLVEYLSCKH